MSRILFFFFILASYEPLKQVTVQIDWSLSCVLEIAWKLLQGCCSSMYVFSSWKTKCDNRQKILLACISMFFPPCCDNEIIFILSVLFITVVFYEYFWSFLKFLLCTKWEQLYQLSQVSWGPIGQWTSDLILIFSHHSHGAVSGD